MKILLLGSGGQLGLTLSSTLLKHGHVFALNHEEGNLEDLEGLRKHIRAYQPDVIVNAAAYTAVDKAETERDKAHLINATAVGVMAEEAHRLGAWLIHYSTEYVFDGTKTAPYIETDATHPINVYGQSKLDGEKAIQAIGGKYFIFRTSWVYSAHRHNFALAILRKALTETTLNVVNDSVGAPTSTTLLAEVTSRVLAQIAEQGDALASASGIYHLTPTGETSWFDYARLLVRLAREQGMPVTVADDAIYPVSSDFYPSIAKRPKNSRLNTRKLSQQFGITLPEWREHVRELVAEIALK
ncbi:MAG: dTDP-4-dehydrorhamnose reductase [Gammaproteobacteria bacterium]